MATVPPSESDIFDEGSPSQGGAQPHRQSGAKRKIGQREFFDRLSDDLKERLVKAPEEEFKKIRQAMAGLSRGGTSTTERIAYRRMIAEANSNIKKIEKENREYIKTHSRFQTVRNDSGVRLKELRKYLGENRDEIDAEALKNLRTMEEALIKSIQKSALDVKDHTNNEEVVELLEKIDKQAGKMPDDLKKRFAEIEAQNAIIVSSQHEAVELIASTNKRIKDFGKRATMNVLDFMGIGSFNLGNLVRGVGKGYSGVKAVGRGFKAANRYVQARRIMMDTRREKVDTNSMSKDMVAKPAPVSPPSPAPEEHKTLPSPIDTAARYAQPGDADFVGPLQKRRGRGKDKQKRRPRESRREMGDEVPLINYASKRAQAAMGRQRDASGRFLPVTPKPVTTSETQRDLPADQMKLEEESLEEQKRLNQLLEEHSASLERFNSRLLAELRGRSKPANESNTALSGILAGLATSIGGIGTMLGGPVLKTIASLAPLLGKVAAVGGAFLAGKWVGDKIYEKYGTNIVDGIQSTVDFGKKLFGQQTDDEKVRDMLQGREKGKPVVSGKVLDLSGGATGDFTRQDRKSEWQTSTAGAGRGSVNPPMAVPSGAPSASPEASSGSASPQPIQTTTSPGAGNGNGRVQDFMGKLFSKSSGVNVEGLHPQMQSSLTQMGREYFEATGKKLNFNSAFRSMEEQEHLYRTKPKGMAARPGSSLHNFGLAVDIPSAQANELDSLGLLGKYGFSRPIANEKWHIQPAGISVAAAKAGVFSADGPANQSGSEKSRTTVARSTAPSVTDAGYEAPGSNVMTESGPLRTGSGGNVTSGSAGGTRISASSIPTFDNSDGAFLALNTGII